jgi:cytochrome P450 family 6
MAVLEIFVAVCVICIALVLRYMLKNRGYLETLGIPIVKPVLIFGSPPFAPHKMVIHEYNQEMHKKLGKTWARYEGREAVIVTIDPELIKSIMVKNFDSFSEIIDWGYPDNKITLDLSGGEQWKALRKVLSPTFTSGKLKSMLEPMDAVVENMLKHIGREIKKNPVISVLEMYQSFALDTISVCAFGIETNSFENSDNQILEWGKKVFSGFICTNWIETG